MPEYRYRCPVGHETDVVHSMLVSVDVFCSECHQPMKRRPMGGGGVFINATEMLLGWMNENYNRKRRGIPKYSPDRVKSYHPHPGNRYGPATKGNER